MESIAWWASNTERTDDARRLLGLADALRGSLHRTRFSVERYAYHVAVARCGDPIPPAAGDHLGAALELADRLVRGPESPARPTSDGLSRPAWL